MKNKKRKKHKPYFAENTAAGQAAGDIKNSLRKFNFKLFLTEFVIFLVMFGTLETANHFSYASPVLFYLFYAYYAALLVLIVVGIVINRGVSFDLPEPEQLSDKMSDEEKHEYIEKLRTGHERAKKLLVVIVPLLFTLLFDYIIAAFF